MQGGTTFHFVTDRIESALFQARDVAGALDVAIAGGASTVNQYLAGCSTRCTCTSCRSCSAPASGCWSASAIPRLEPAEVIPSPAATHIRYRVSR
jgi:hypothetical protein